MNSIIALSTCWLSHRHKDGYEMLSEVAQLGFEWVELSHGIRPFLVEGILRAVKDKVIRVCSIHNFCPLPGFVNGAAPNLYEPSDKDVRRRMLWFKYTQETLRFAANVKAQHCVLHSGHIPLFWHCPQSRLRYWRKNYLPDALETNPAYQKWLSRSMKHIKKKSPKYINNVSESLKMIIPLARRQGIKLALENRDRLGELPLDECFADFLKNFGEPDVLGYCHDVGHAQIKEQLGVIKQRVLLEKMQDRLIGVHIHDVNVQGEDHQALGKGCVDFYSIKPFLKKNIPFILEMNPRISPEDVIRSRDYLSSLLIA